MDSAVCTAGADEVDGLAEGRFDRAGERAGNGLDPRVLREAVEAAAVIGNGESYTRGVAAQTSSILAMGALSPWR